MPTRACYVIGIGAIAQQTLEQIITHLGDAYGALEDMQASEWLALSFDVAEQALIPPAKTDGLHFQQVCLDDALRADWLGSGRADLGLTEHWVTLNLGRRWSARQINRRRQLMRLVFLHRLVTAPEALLRPIGDALSRLQAQQLSTVDVHFVGSLGDVEMSAWYLDLANLVRYAAHKRGLSTRLLLHTALPMATVDPTDRNEFQRRQIDSFAFWQELAHFDTPDEIAAHPLYPAYMTPLVQYNSHQAMSEHTLLYAPDDAIDDIDERRSALCKQMIDGLLPLLDETGGSKFTEHVLVNEDAQQFTQDTTQRVTLMRTQGLHLPLNVLRAYWIDKLAYESLVHIQQGQSDETWQTVLDDLLREGIAYHSPFPGHKTQGLPDILVLLYGLLHKHPSERDAARALNAIDASELSNALTGTTYSLAESDTRRPSLEWLNNYPSNDDTQLFVDDVRQQYRAQFVGDSVDETAYLVRLRQRIQAMQDDLPLVMAGAVSYALKQLSPQETLDLLQALTDELTAIAALADTTQSFALAPDRLLDKLKSQGRPVRTLRKRPFLVGEPKPTREVESYIYFARDAYDDARRYYIMTCVQDIVHAAQTAIKTVRQALRAVEPIIWKGASALVNQIAAPTYQQPASRLTLTQSWADDYYYSVIRPHSQKLRDSLQFQWERTPSGAIHLRYLIDQHIVHDGQRAAARWLAEARHVVWSASQSLRLWDIWHDDQQRLDEAEGIAHLQTMSPFISYTRPSDGSHVLSAIVYVSPPRIDDSGYIAGRQRIFQALQSDYSLREIVDVTAASYVIYQQMVFKLPLAQLDRYRQARQAYTNLRPEKRAEHHVLSGEVQAAMLEADGILSLGARTLLTQPQYPKRFLELLVLGLLKIDPQDDRYMVMLDDGTPIYLTDTGATRSVKGAMRALTRINQESDEWRELVATIEIAQAQTIDAVLAGDVPLARDHAELWQLVKDLTPMSDHASYERDAIMAQLIWDYRADLYGEALDESIRQLLLSLAEKQMTRLIERLQDITRRM